MNLFWDWERGLAPIQLQQPGATATTGHHLRSERGAGNRPKHHDRFNNRRRQRTTDLRRLRQDGGTLSPARWGEYDQHQSEQRGQQNHLPPIRADSLNRRCTLSVQRLLPLSAPVAF
jgi:hypothetical protein